MKPQRILPADVYDALELSAWAYGGIGASSYDDAFGYPLCAYGHGRAVEGKGPGDLGFEVWDALINADIGSSDNDWAVRAINERHGAPPNVRVPFNKWCKELNVVRGE